MSSNHADSLDAPPPLPKRSPDPAAEVADHPRSSFTKTRPFDLTPTITSTTTFDDDAETGIGGTSAPQPIPSPEPRAPVQLHDSNSPPPPPLPKRQQPPVVVSPPPPPPDAASSPRKSGAIPEQSPQLQQPRRRARFESGSSTDLPPPPSSASIHSNLQHAAAAVAAGELTNEELSFQFDRHVQEIRRRRTVAKRAPPPDREEFTRIETETGKRVLDVKHYIEAYVLYFIELLARDNNKNKRQEPLQWSKIRSMLGRLYDTSGPAQSLGLYVERVMLWKNPPETFAWFMVYFTLWFYQLWIPGFLMLFVLKILHNRYGFLGDFKEVLNVPHSLNEQLKEKEQSRKSKVRSQLRELIQSKDITDWISQMIKIWGPYLQAMGEEYINYLERLKNLFRWKRPMQTWRIVGLLTFYITVSTFFQFLVLPAIGFAIGVEFFMLLPLQKYYPRFSHLFSPVEWVLWDVPTNAELAVELLTKQEEERRNQEAMAGSSSSRTNGEGDSFSSEETATTEGRKRDSGISQHAAGLSEAERVIYEYESRTKGRSSTGLSTASDTRSIDSTQSRTEFACLLRGKPGRLMIAEDALQFRTAKLLGREVELQITWEKIDSIKKSKTMKIAMWSMPGIEVTDIDGQVTTFQNVVHRDEAFRRLVITSGKKWTNVA